MALQALDRLFPNQDTMPAGGFGNLIALPLAKAPRERGNTAFLCADVKPVAAADRTRLSADRIFDTTKLSVPSRPTVETEPSDGPPIEHILAA